MPNLNDIISTKNRLKNNPVIQLYATRGKYKVYIVDGAKARKLDEEITNWATSKTSKMVPKNEIWLDKANNTDEYPALMDQAITYDKAIEQGQGKDEAYGIADRKYEDEVGALKGDNENKNKPPNPAITKKVELKKIGIAPDGGSIILVDGEGVRKSLDPVWTEGGHDLVYKFIPKSYGDKPRYWIDDQVDQKEIPYMILHETTERPLMAKGEPYEKAHREASKKEHQERMKENVTST
jgi:hypothetical protein